MDNSHLGASAWVSAKKPVLLPYLSQRGGPLPLQTQSLCSGTFLTPSPHVLRTSPALDRAEYLICGVMLQGDGGGHVDLPGNMTAFCRRDASGQHHQR